LARAVSWSELGYSSSGIAKRLEVTEGTARSYLDEIEERWETSAAFAKAESELAVETTVGSGDES
jgi:transposase